MLVFTNQKVKIKEEDGIFMLVFTNQKVKIKEGQLIFPKIAGLKLNTRMKEVRIIPKGVSYVVELMKRKWM